MTQLKRVAFDGIDLPCEKNPLCTMVGNVKSERYNKNAHLCVKHHCGKSVVCTPRTPVFIRKFEIIFHAQITNGNNKEEFLSL